MTYHNEVIDAACSVMCEVHEFFGTLQFRAFFCFGNVIFFTLPNGKRAEGDCTAYSISERLGSKKVKQLRAAQRGGEAKEIAKQRVRKYLINYISKEDG